MSKDLGDCLLLSIWEEVCVPLSHFIGLVSDPGIDHSLINFASGTVTDEAVTKDMPAAKS